jgi:hypothetical protein
MAVIIKEEREYDVYQRIDINRCFIKTEGLYIGTIVYKSKSERDKEKNREQDILSFLNNVSDEYKRLISEETTLEERELAYTEYFSDVVYVSEQIKKIAYEFYYFPEILDENPNISLPQRITLNEKNLISAERFGFKREWYSDPILIIREDLIFLDEYKKQDFTLDEFYNLFKNNILNFNGNEIIFEDDL